MPTAAIGPAIGGVTSLLGGILGSGAAGKASGLEAGVLGQNANQLAGVGQQMMTQELNRLKPYMQGGAQGFNTLASLLRTPGQGLLQGYGSFTAPNPLNFQQDPSYQWRLDQGMKALQNSAAAKGDLLSGNTLRALNTFGQGEASQEYQNAYNRAANTYGMNANTFYQNQANQFNRLAGLGGMGLQAAGGANQANQAYQNLYGNAMGMSNQAGGAAAQGIMGQNAAWENALGGLGNAGMAYSTLSQLGQLGGGAGAMMSPSVLSSLPLAGPSGSAAYGLGSLAGMGGFGVGGYGVGYPTPYNQSGY